MAAAFEAAVEVGESNSKAPPPPCRLLNSSLESLAPDSDPWFSSRLGLDIL